MFIGSSYNLNNNVCNQPVLINVSVPHTDTYKCLGVEIDEKLHWKNILKHFARRPVQASEPSHVLSLLYLPIGCKLYIKP